MKSIQSKFILLILVGVILSSVLIGGIGIYSYNIGANNESAEKLNMLAEYNASEINGIMGRIEQSVEVIAGCAEEFVADPARLSDPAYFNEYMDYLRPIMLNAAYATDDSVSVYIRLNPEISTSNAGLFYIRKRTDTYFSLEPNTDISIYERDDIEHVGWWYIPVENALNGQPATWMRPYLNKNIDIYMISYVVPIFCGDELLGIVGMDIDFTMLQELVDSLHIYDTGFAYLAEEDDNFTIVHHKALEQGTNSIDENIEFVSVIENYDVDIDNANLYDYEHNGVKKRMCYKPLNNGFDLMITAPVSEIDHDRNVMLAFMACITAVICGAFIAVTIIVCRNLVRPLRKLTEETKKIAEGDMSVEIQTRTQDEVGVLAGSFRDMAEKLRVYIARINKLANTDSLTGADNKTAYAAAIAELEVFSGGDMRFAVAVLDINGLKQTNDTRGHSSGDALITRCAAIIRGSFNDCPVYRIGGDEFAVLLRGEHYDKRGEYMSALESAIEADREAYGEVYGVLAYGMAEYTSRDKCYEDVFNRADAEMYSKKKMMKGAAR
ncbi:MAG: diguanylate cyclase [Oscillospiraceae bacterium]|nr:diguanylate cyclase [Oscillospiraceae bacterium]